MVNNLNFSGVTAKKIAYLDNDYNEHSQKEYEDFLIKQKQVIEELTEGFKKKFPYATSIHVEAETIDYKQFGLVKITKKEVKIDGKGNIIDLPYKKAPERTQEEIDNLMHYLSKSNN